MYVFANTGITLFIKLSLSVVVGNAPLISNSDTRLISGTAKYRLIQPLNGVLYMSEYEGMIYLFKMTVAEFRFTPLYDPK
jgi:hypothetical protein